MRIRWNYNMPGWIALEYVWRVRGEQSSANADFAVIDKLSRIARYIIDTSDDNSIVLVD